jgi:hypothetical protein
MKKLLALGLLLFCGQAVAQSTLPAIQDQINAIIRTNSVGAITAANLNPLLQTMAQSSVLRLNNLNDLGNIATARTNLGLTYFATGTNAANLTGTIPASVLGSGFSNNSVFLRGDGVWTNSIVGSIFTNSFEITGSTPITRTFTGSGSPALMWSNISVAASSATLPEIGQQVTMTSNVGIANLTTAYKVAFTPSLICGAQSADCYGINTIVQGVGGTHLVVGHEVDINNVGVAATTIGAPTAVYANVSVAAGSATSTAAYWATGATAKWQYGFAVSDYGAQKAAEYGFYDKSTSTTAFIVENTHTTVLDASNCVCSFGIVLPNNIPAIYQKDTTATLRNVIKLDNTNNIAIGYSTGFTTAYGTLMPEGNIAVTWGLTNRRPGAIYTYNMDMSGPSIIMSALPSVAGATGTLYKDASNFVKVSP